MSNLKKSIRKSLVVGGFCMMSSLAMSAQISLTLENKSTRDVIREIERVSEYRFFYNEDLQGLDQKISINTNDANIQTVLNEIQRQTSIHYVIKENNQIVLSAGVKSNKTQQVGDNRIIKGTILDATGMPVIGANVVVKGTTNGTITDMDGKFSLEVDKNAILVVSYIGYANQEIKVGNQNTLSITMKEDAEALDELVVVGYGVQKKVNLTAAVETVNSEVLENRPVKSATEMLEGVVPNLNISTTSGAPDATSSLNIRGFTGMSMNGTNMVTQSGSPLVLVDGVEQSLDMVNPNDIESISVLKDAAASAIYGSRAPYGVVLITTKSGKKGMKTSINYSGTFQINQPTMIPSSASSVEFAKTLNAAMNNSLKEGYYSEEVIQKMQDYIDGKLLENNEILSNGRWGEHTDAFANTDYFDYAFKDHSLNTTHDLNVSGGTDKTAYYAGLGYSYREGIYNTDLDTYDRYTAMLKVDTEITKWLSFNMNTRYVRQETTRPNYRNADSSSNSDNSFWQNLAYFPNIPIKNPDGSYHRLSAMPILEGLGGNMNKTVDDFWFTGGVKLNPIEGLNIKGNFSWNQQSYVDDRTTLQFYVEEPNGEVLRGARSSTLDKVWKESAKSNYFTMDLTADYHKAFGMHDLTALVGMQMEQKQNNNMIGATSGLYTSELPSLNTSWGDNMTLKEEKNHWSTMGYFFRLSYNYDSRYLLDVNGRFIDYLGAVDHAYKTSYPGLIQNQQRNPAYTGFRIWKGTSFDPAEIDNGEVDDLILRYEEGLLNYVEAKAILGLVTQDDLDKTINVIRSRVNLPNMSLSEVNGWNIDYDKRNGYDPSAPNIVNEIRRERRVELMLEGLRFMDIKRWAMLDDVFNGWKPVGAYAQEYVDYWNNPDRLAADGFDWKSPKEVKLEKGINYDTIGDYINPFFKHADFQLNSGRGYYVDPDRDYLSSIPREEITLYKNKGNVTLEQNPGWF